MTKTVPRRREIPVEHTWDVASIFSSDQAAAAKNDRARSLLARAMATMAFAAPELLPIKAERLRRWMKDDVRLAVFEHYFDQLWHRSWRLRREALGYDTLYVYDTRAPLTRKQPQVPYAKAVEWICEGLQPLGEE